jgi:hypothetical protein
VTDTTAARRQLLALLLDRVEYGNLLDAERPLLRPLVLAEQGAADAATTPDNDPDARLRRITDALTAEHYRRAEQQIVASPEEHSAAMAAAALVALDGRHWRGTDGIDMATAYMDGQAALARIRVLVAEWRDWNPAETAWAVRGIERALSGEGDPQPQDPDALDGPSPTPDDAQATADRAALAFCSPLVNAACPGHQGPPYCNRAPSNPTTEPTTSTVTDWATTINEQCPARYTGDSPHLTDAPGESVDYRCGRRGHGLDSDHAIRLDHKVVFCWADAIAVYPLDDAPSEPQP